VAIHTYESLLGKTMHEVQAPDVLCVFCRNSRPATFCIMLWVILPEVANILARSNPLKIFNRIISLVSVLVVYLRKIVWIWNKRLSNQTMNAVRSWFAFVPKLDRFVAETHYDDSLGPFSVLDGLHRSVFIDPVFSIKARYESGFHASTSTSLMLTTNHVAV